MVSMRSGLNQYRPSQALTLSVFLLYNHYWLVESTQLHRPELPKLCGFSEMDGNTIPIIDEVANHAFDIPYQIIVY